MLDAKMIGITPAVLTRSGMCVLWPPYILRPTMRLAYWTGILRVACVMTTTAATTSTMIAAMITIWMTPRLPARTLSIACMTRFGTPPRMLTKMTSEMPLPMPNSVIFSPSHMTRMVPVVCVTMVDRKNARPGSGTTRQPLRGAEVHEEDAVGVGLHDRDDHRADARVLGDLLLALFAFLAQLLEVRNDRAQQLENDRRTRCTA